MKYPDVRADLVHLVAMLADPERQHQEWVIGRPGWEPWADEFSDDINDGYAAVEGPIGEIDLSASIGETLANAREAEALRPLFALLEVVDQDVSTRSLPSRDAAALTVRHPRWGEVVAVAQRARAVLDDTVSDG